MPSSNPAQNEPGRSFEEQVADTYRALGYHVEPNVSLAGQQVDLLATRTVEGGPSAVLAVECKDHSQRVGNQIVQEFVHTVSALRAGTPVTAGVLVSATGFTADARAVATPPTHVLLLSWDELTSQLLAVGHRLRDIVKDYEHDPIFVQYLQPRIELLDWNAPSPRVRAASGKLDALVQSWIESGSQGASGLTLFVLGDFGSGKTTLIRRLQYDRAKAHLERVDQRIPLFVPLRTFRDSYDVTTMLRTSFRESYHRDVPPDLISRLVNTGGLYLLLDGFDEMVDRSDAERRLELFYKLMPLFRSASPSVFTSRPSYFVDRGELEAVVTSLRGHEASLSAPVRSTHGGLFTQADRLRRQLVARRRESLPEPSVSDLAPRDALAIALKPLTPEDIERYLESREPELNAVGTGPDAVVNFIRRTYDLTDLATRPLLLTLIVDSVVAGGLDLSDPSIVYGPAGLYEIYTHTKLDLDLSKGGSRAHGLTLEQRRLLAEAIALKMYKAEVLELDFRRALEEILDEDKSVRDALAASPLAQSEIATDFATSSFVTLDSSGRCRFIHKSFRGFFVARVLKEGLRGANPLLFDWLESEVLYFLGGFAPTQPRVGDSLWSRYRQTDVTDAALRRNMLVAFLHSRPEHDSRRIDDSDIADTSFGSLTFNSSRMRRTAWRGCQVRALALNDANWRDISFVESHVGDLRVARGELDLALSHTTVEQIDVQSSSLGLAGSDARVDAISAADAKLHLAGNTVEFGEMLLTNSEVDLSDGRGQPSVGGQITARDSRLAFSHPLSTRLAGERSAIACARPPEVQIAWKLRSSGVRFRKDRTGEISQWQRDAPVPSLGISADERSVLMCDEAVTAQMLKAGCGVFGPIDSPKPLTIDRPTSGWGVLFAESNSLGSFPALQETRGLRYGKFLVVQGAVYAAEVEAGALQGLYVLRELCDGEGLTDRWDAQGLGKCLARVRSEYEAFLDRAWIEAPT